MSKPWKKPEFIILTRGQPEESVLTACKLFDPATGPMNANNHCQEVPCGICYLQGTS